MLRFCLFADIVLSHDFMVLQEKDFWKAELKEFSSKNGYDMNRNGDCPLLLDVLEGFLKFEVFLLVACFHDMILYIHH